MGGGAGVQNMEHGLLAACTSAWPRVARTPCEEHAHEVEELAHVRGAPGDPGPDDDDLDRADVPAGGGMKIKGGGQGRFDCGRNVIFTCSPDTRK